MPSKIFGVKGGGSKRKMEGNANEKLYDMYFSPNIIFVITPKTTKGAGRVTCMGRTEIHTGFWWENLKSRPL